MNKLTGSNPASGICVISEGVEDIVFHSGCCNRIRSSGRLMNNKHVCLTVLEAGTKIKVLVYSVSGGGLLPGPRMTVISLCSPMARRGEGALWGVCYQGPNPIPENPPS